MAIAASVLFHFWHCMPLLHFFLPAGICGRPMRFQIDQALGGKAIQSYEGLLLTTR